MIHSKSYGSRQCPRYRLPNCSDDRHCLSNAPHLRLLTSASWTVLVPVVICSPIFSQSSEKFPFPFGRSPSWSPSPSTVPSAAPSTAPSDLPGGDAVGFVVGSLSAEGVSDALLNSLGVAGVVREVRRVRRSSLVSSLVASLIASGRSS